MKNLTLSNTKLSAIALVLLSLNGLVTCTEWNYLKHGSDWDFASCTLNTYV